MRTRTLLFGLVAVLLSGGLWAAPALARGGDGNGEFLPLRDGEILVGEITDHNEDGLEMKRLDNGGIVKLRWNQLAPPIENTLREKYGYKHDEVDEVVVEVDEITLLDGTKRAGRILAMDDKSVTLKEKASTLAYDRSSLDGPPHKASVPALEVYTKDDLYAEALSNYDLGTTRGHLDLSRYLEGIRDFDRALKHVEEAKKLDTAGQFTKELNGSTIRIAEKKARQDELDYLAEIEIQRNRHNWDKSMALCDDFAAKFPKALDKTKSDVMKRKDNIAGAKKIDYTKRVSEAMHDYVRRLIRNKTLDRKIPYATAISYIGSELKKELITTVAARLLPQSKEFTEGYVQQLWSDRSKDPRTKPKDREVTYGSGTFVLGKDKAKENLANLPGGGATPNGPVKSKEEQDAEAKLKKFLERQAGGGNGTTSQQKAQTPDQWYERATEFERSQYLLAKFVEDSGGFFEISQRFGRNCINCGGKGAVEIQQTAQAAPSVQVGGGRGGAQKQTPNSGTIEIQCPACHGVQVERLLRYH